jgi:hypothetical protein
MAPSSRDRISVDLHGLKAALLARAQAQGVSPSVLVRSLVAESMGRNLDPAVQPQSGHQPPPRADRARLCLRMSRAEAADVLSAARRAGMCPGSFVAGLVAGVPAIQSGRGRGDHVAALIASNAELASLSRNIHHLSSLLRVGDVEPARVYRGMLDTMGADIRRHLELASHTLAELRPHGRASGACRHSHPTREGRST